MTSKELHKAHIKEHIQVIEDAIAVGAEKRPATIGLHTSACSIELLELYLHSLGKLSSGAMIKHDWFKKPSRGQKITPLAERKVPVDFPNKKEIFSLIYDIEDERNKLIYGKPSKLSAEAVLKAFNELHHAIKEKLKELGEEIE